MSIIDFSKTFAKAYENGPYLGLDKTYFDSTQNRGPRHNWPYLFIKLNDVKDNNKRHCKITRKGTFFDYIVKKEFNNLEEWAHDCNSSVIYVDFGYDSEGPRYLSHNLAYLIHSKKIVPYFKTTPVKEVTDFDRLSQKLSTMNLGFNNVAVVYDNKVVMSNEFMKE